MGTKSRANCTIQYITREDATSTSSCRNSTPNCMWFLPSPSTRGRLSTSGSDLQNAKLTYLRNLPPSRTRLLSTISELQTIGKDIGWMKIQAWRECLHGFAVRTDQTGLCMSVIVQVNLHRSSAYSIHMYNIHWSWSQLIKQVAFGGACNKHTIRGDRSSMFSYFGVQRKRRFEQISRSQEWSWHQMSGSRRACENPQFQSCLTRGHRACFPGFLVFRCYEQLLNEALQCLPFFGYLSCPSSLTSIWEQGPSIALDQHQHNDWLANSRGFKQTNVLSTLCWFRAEAKGQINNPSITTISSRYWSLISNSSSQTWWQDLMSRLGWITNPRGLN